MAMSMNSRVGLPMATRKPCLNARRPMVVTASAQPALKASQVIKRAPSAYNLWFKENYKTVQEQLAKNGVKPSLPECASALRVQWSALSDEAKAPFVVQSQGLKEEVAVFRKAAKKAVKQAAKENGASDTPKVKAAPRPKTVWQVYLAEQLPLFKAKNPDLKMTEITKLVSASYKNLSEAEKNKLKAARDEEVARTKTMAPAAPAKKVAEPAPAKARNASPAPSVKVAAASTRAATPKKGTPAKA